MTAPDHMSIPFKNDLASQGASTLESMTQGHSGLD